MKNDFVIVSSGQFLIQDHELIVCDDCSELQHEDIEENFISDMM